MSSRNRTRKAVAATGDPTRAAGPAGPSAPPAPPRRGPGRPRKAPGVELGTSPIHPSALPPNPGPSASSARAVGGEFANELDPLDAPAGLDPAELVDTLEGLRLVVLGIYASAVGVEEDPEISAKMQLSRKTRRTLDALAPSVVPYVERVLPNAGPISLVAFGAVFLLSLREPFRAIKAKAKPRDDGPAPGIPPAPAAAAPASNGHVARASEDPLGEPWPEFGAPRPAAPGT